MARPKKTSAKTASARGKKQSKELHPHQERAQMSADLKAQTAEIKLLKSTRDVKRPPNNPDMPQDIIDNLNNDFASILDLLDNFSQHLRALDRMRLNGVGIKKLGFIERAYELSLENGEFLPHYLTVEKFGRDIQYFTDFRSLTDMVMQIREKIWNITIQSADIAYTDALEFYASVREAAKRRIDSAETLHHELSPFFKHRRNETEQPTKKQALRDFKALQNGKHDGKLIIENEKPKMTGGVRKVIDETYKDTAKFKDTIDEDIEE